MAREVRPERTDQPKRQPEPDREGQRRGGQNTEKQGRDFPSDKESGRGRQGERRN